MKKQKSMNLLLAIALGKSVYTIIFLVVMVCSGVLALKLQNELATTVALVLVGIFGGFIIVTAVVTTNEAIESLIWPK